MTQISNTIIPICNITKQCYSGVCLIPTTEHHVVKISPAVPEICSQTDRQSDRNTPLPHWGGVVMLYWCLPHTDNRTSCREGIGPAVPELCSQTDRQINWSQYSAPLQECSNNVILMSALYWQPNIMSWRSVQQFQSYAHRQTNWSQYSAPLPRWSNNVILMSALYWQPNIMWVLLGKSQILTFQTLW